MFLDGARPEAAGVESVHGSSSPTLVTRVKGKSGESIRLLGTRDGVELSLEGTHLLVAGGRTPNTSGIGLDKAGVETTERGHGARVATWEQ